MAMTKEEQEAFQHLLDNVYRNDIAAFSEDMFGIKLTRVQREFADAFLTDKRISFKGGIGFGKTTVCAIAIWWALFCFDDLKVTIFGPTETQVTNSLWNDIEKLYNKLEPALREGFDYSATEVVRKHEGASCYATWRTVNKDNVGSIAGIHATNNFIFVDEAADVDDIAFKKVLVSHLTTDANPKLVLVSNPRKTSGFFFNTWCGDIADMWTHVHGRMQDGPNFDPAELENAAKQWGGRGSNEYLVNVEGDFPNEDADGLISARLIEEAIEREDIIPSERRLVIWGVDPAGPGKDKSVILKRHDNVITDISTRANLTITQLSYLVRDMFQALPKLERQNTVIAVDANGLGRGLADNLKDFGLPVRPVTTQSSPTKGKDVYGNDKYAKLRDQLWWQVKEWFETEAVRIPYHKELIRELKGPTYGYDNAGRIKVEGKTEMKKRLSGVSPDHADALCLTFAVDAGRYIGKYSWSRPIAPDDLRWAE